MADNQPTILVKKADGSFVRVPLSELKKKDAPPAAQKAVTPTPPAPPLSISKVPPAPKVSPAPSTPKVTTLPDKTKKEELPTPKKAAGDFKSLLEENEFITSELLPKISASRDSDVDLVVKNLSFSVPASFAGRLRGIVQSRIKDIRGERETRDLVLQSIKDGGLGLTDAQAEELEKKCLAQMDKVGSGEVAPLKVKRVEPTPKLPQKKSEPLSPAISTPFNAFVHEEPKVEELIRPIAPADSFKISSNFKTKPVVQDVVSRPIELGPVDEIKFMRLLDFRRLASNSTEAANRLKQKFINLKEESVLLFMQAIDAWHESPLYQDYLAMVDQAFIKKIGLTAVTSDKEKISFEEIKALVNMEKELGI